MAIAKRAAVELGVFEVLPAEKIDGDRLFGVAPGIGDRLLKTPGELGYIYQTNRRTWELTDNGEMLDLNMLAIAGSCDRRKLRGKFWTISRVIEANRI